MRDAVTGTPHTDAAARRERSALAGARAGRGFRYQDAVTGAFAIVGHVAGEGWTIAPEGDEDVTIAHAGRRFQLQIRSRVGQRSDVTEVQVGDWLADTWTRHADQLGVGTRVGIVVDRPIKGLDALGFSATLENAPDATRARLEPLAQQWDTSVDELLSRSHLFLAPEPTIFASDLLAQHRTVPPLVAEVVVRQIIARVGAIADQRASGNQPAEEFDAGELARLIDDTLAVVDLQSVEGPVRDGLCEHADFVTPVAEAAFYSGVDVVPGHIAAGLVVDRPDEVEDVLRVLKRARSAIVTGPSGVGKTAVALLAAWSSRDTVRWIRVRRVGPAHELVRYAAALRATEYAPVGFLIDDIGRLGSTLWDELAREARHRPGILLLGTTREEDLDLLEEAPESIVLRPRLSAALAEALWSHLLAQGETAVPGWREAFEDSDGLTLEFVHMLTTGRRLPDLIAEQVDKRRREQRDDELWLIRVAAYSAARGATTDLRRFMELTSLGETDVQRVLARLLDEHLIRTLPNGRVGGVHRLRSLALVEAAHRIPPPTLAETATEAIFVAPAEEVVGVVASVASGELVTNDDLFDALDKRLASDPTHATLADCLDGLRLAGIKTFADSANGVLDAHEVPLAMRHTAASLSRLSNSDLSDAFDDRVRAAVEELRGLLIPDLRGNWLERAPATSLANAITAVKTPQAAARVLSSFAGLGAHPAATALTGLDSLVTASAPLEELAAVFEAARLAGPDIAHRLADATGGEAALLERTRRELPWITSVEIAVERDEDDNAMRVLTFKHLGITADEHHDVHDAVVERCRLFMRLFPAVDIVAGTAVDTAGRPMGYGDHVIADKRIPRDNLPSPSQVLWNRHLLNAFAEAGPESRTFRLAAEVRVFRATDLAARPAAQAWVRREPLRDELAIELERISRDAQQVWKREHSPSDPSTVATSEPDIGDLAQACRLLTGNAIPRLFTTPNMALAGFIGSTVRRSFEGLVGIGYWRLATEDLDMEVAALASVLADVHQVLGSRLAQEAPSSAMRRAERSATPVQKAAQVARRELAVAFDQRVQQCRRRLAALGSDATAVVLDDEKGAGLLWPEGSVGFLIDFESTFDWLLASDKAMAVASEEFELTRIVTLVPCRDGLALPSFGIRVSGGGNGAAFPGLDSARRAAETLSRPATV